MGIEPSGIAAIDGRTVRFVARAPGWRRAMRFAAAASAALLIAGCVHATPEPERPPLRGTEWRLVEFQSSKDAIGTIRPAEGEVHTIQMMPDGTLVAGLYCNRGNGRWSSPDAASASGTIHLEMMVMTMATCPPTPLARLGDDLARIRTFVIRDGRLYLNLIASGGNYVWQAQ